jgi:hypothetical protein
MPKLKKVSVEGLRSGLQREYLTLQNIWNFKNILVLGCFSLLGSAFGSTDPIKSVHNSDPILENSSKGQDDIRFVKKKTACESNFVYPKAYLFTFQFLTPFSSQKHKATAKTWERSFVYQNYKHN